MDSIDSNISSFNTPSTFINDDVLELTKDYPSYTLTIEQRLKILANLIVDRLFEDQQKNPSPLEELEEIGV